MLKHFTVLIAVAIASFVAANTANAQVYVRGYMRSNGTYVQPHYRSQPDGYFYNNWSSYPNTNPYTGRVGTRLTPSYSGSYSTGYQGSGLYSYPGYQTSIYGSCWGF